VDIDALLTRIQAQVSSRAIRVTDHAREEMEDESISLSEVSQAILNGQIIENYPEHKCGACCLLFRITSRKRPLHIVCTTSFSMLVIITVYVPTFANCSSLRFSQVRMSLTSPQSQLSPVQSVDYIEGGSREPQTKVTVNREEVIR